MYIIKKNVFVLVCYFVCMEWIGAQCACPIYSEYNSACLASIKKAHVSNNIHTETLSIRGKFILGVDSIQILQNDVLIYSGLVQNKNLDLDGDSFYVDIDRSSQIVIILNSCKYPIDVRLKVGVIEIEKSNTELLFEFY